MGKASSAKKIQRVQQAGVSRRPGQRRALGFPALVVVLVIIGCVLVAFARQSKGSSVAVAPQANKDYWNYAYGIYDCDHFLPNLVDGAQGNVTGIHTDTLGGAGDGLIHIQPKVASVAGKNATLGKFATDTGLKIGSDDQSLEVPGGPTLKNGGTCKIDGKERKASLALYVWPPDSGKTKKPTVIRSDFENFRFTQDRSIIVLGFVPSGVTPPQPPSVDNLKNPTAGDATTPQSTTPSTPDTTVSPSTPPVTAAPSSPTTVAGTAVQK